jgi:hypothetical protein
MPAYPPDTDTITFNNLITAHMQYTRVQSSLKPRYGTTTPELMTAKAGYIRALAARQNYLKITNAVGQF